MNIFRNLPTTLIMFCSIASLALFIQPFHVDAAQQKSNVPAPQVVGQHDKQAVTGKGGNGNDEIPGEWYVGATPPNLIEDAPVLLFIPGLNNTAQVWWENNNMYETAYEAGYLTAFVQLFDAGGASADMWDNGRLLAEKIQEISTYFAGKEIVIVAYSKGGVDTQTALTYYGASDIVADVITLSSPHHGSQLADLAYSYWAGWLAELIGMRGDGTYVMETGYMEHFRSITDDKPDAYANDYFTFGGVDWGPPFSGTWFGGIYLSRYGDNDGVVTAASSNLPGGQEVAICDWNHVSIRTGIMFSEIENVLNDKIDSDKMKMKRQLTPKDDRKNVPQMNQTVLGGALDQNSSNQIRFSVEDQVEQVTLNLLTADDMSQIRLLDANGKPVTPNIASHTDEHVFFPGAIQNTITIDRPVVGEWTLDLEVDKDSAYLLVVDYEVDRKTELMKKTAEKAKLTAENQFHYQLEALPNQVQEHTLEATYYVQMSGKPEKTKIYNVERSANLSQQISFEQTNEVYTITVDVKGKTKAGADFERTIIDSIYIGE